MPCSQGGSVAVWVSLFGVFCTPSGGAFASFLKMGNALPPENRNHNLTGNWRGHRECHIQPDWLLIYRVEGDVLVLTLSRTGTHSDLFGK